MISGKKIPLVKEDHSIVIRAKAMRIKDILKLFFALNLLNKIRLVFHISLTIFFRLTGRRLLGKLRLNFHGIEYEVTIGKGELDIIYHTNLLREYMQLEDFIPRTNAVCLDVGANFGSTSLAWTLTMKKGGIYAIEPHPETHLSLLRNIQLNEKTETIFPRQIAISAVEGEIALFVSDQGTMAMKPGNHRWRGKDISVRSMTLDRFLKTERIESIDILKIDIEGFEVEALQGGKETLKRTKRVVLEYHSSESRVRCLEILSLNGFDVSERDTLIFGWRK